VIKHGPLTFDATGRVAYLNDQMIELSARELSLLEVLLQRAGRLVSKDQLVERLCEWGEEVSNNAIEVYIHRLRKKIEQGPVRIATVRGLGYCLERSQGDVPDEVAPLVGAINDLLQRLDKHDRHAAPLPGRRRAPAQDPAGRACACRPNWPRARSTAAAATRRR
jgi:DNA-binding winged helix-turn-helix (wHTH) protein